MFTRRFHSRWTGLTLGLAFPVLLWNPLIADDPKAASKKDVKADTSKESTETKSTETKTTETPAAEGYERFDLEVREDIFAGFEGNEKRLKKGMETCEKMLEKNPKHAEAMVWRGAARVFLSGLAFQKGDQRNGIQMWTSGLADLGQAKKLAPNSIAILIPRAAVLMGAGRSAPPAMGVPLLKEVKADFEATYERQKNMLDQLGEHPLGELRMGLADVYRLLGENDKSKQQLEAVVKELPDTSYSERATKWLAAKPDAKLAHNCIGCHTD